MPKTLEQLAVETRAKVNAQLAAGVATIHRLSADGRWSESGKTEQIDAAKAATANEVSATLKAATDRIGRVQAKAIEALVQLQPSDAALAAAAVILAPVVAVASSNPDAIVKTYSRVYDDMGQRILLEKTAESLMDILPQHQINQFAPAFEQARRRMASQQSPEERAARDTFARAQAAQAYLDDAAIVATQQLAIASRGTDLATLAAGNRDVGAMIAATTAAHRLQMFERTVPAVEADTRPVWMKDPGERVEIV